MIVDQWPAERPGPPGPPSASPSPDRTRHRSPRVCSVSSSTHQARPAGSPHFVSIGRPPVTDGTREVSSRSCGCCRRTVPFAVTATSNGTVGNPPPVRSRSGGSSYQSCTGCSDDVIAQASGVRRDQRHRQLRIHCGHRPRPRPCRRPPPSRTATPRPRPRCGWSHHQGSPSGSSSPTPVRSAAR